MFLSLNRKKASFPEKEMRNILSLLTFYGRNLAKLEKAAEILTHALVEQHSFSITLNFQFVCVATD